MMKDYGRLTLKVFALIVLNDLLDSVSQLLLKKGVHGTGAAEFTLNNIVEFALRNAVSPLVICGFLIGLLNYLLWLVILYRMDLSVAMPVGSTIYIFIPVMSIAFLHERVSPIRWAGIILIIIGIHLVAKSRNIPKGAA